MSSSTAAQRVEILQALGLLAQVQAHGDAMRDGGVVLAAVEMLDDDEAVTVAAAEAIRHLACANQSNRIAAREAGAIPRLVRLLRWVADAPSDDAVDQAADAPSDQTIDETADPTMDGTADQTADTVGRSGAPSHRPSVPAAADPAGVVTAVTAALRNLSFMNGARGAHTHGH